VSGWDHRIHGIYSQDDECDECDEQDECRIKRLQIAEGLGFAIEETAGPSTALRTGRDDNSVGPLTPFRDEKLGGKSLT